MFEDELQEAYRATTVEGVHRNLLWCVRACSGLQRLAYIYEGGVDRPLTKYASNFIVRAAHRLEGLGIFEAVDIKMAEAAASKVCPSKC